jgi:hypothetical protein
VCRIFFDSLVGPRSDTPNTVKRLVLVGANHERQHLDNVRHSRMSRLMGHEFDGILDQKLTTRKWLILPGLAGARSKFVEKSYTLIHIEGESKWLASSD